MNLRLLSAILPAALCCFGIAHASDWSYREPSAIDPLAGDALVCLETPGSSYVLEGIRMEGSGDLELAAAFYIAALQSDAGNFEVLLRLAGCYGQLGEASLAADALRLAQASGLRSVEHWIGDPRFDNVREDYSFALAAEVLRSREQRYLEQMGQVMEVPISSMGSVRYFLPEDYDEERSYPLLVMLHGATGTPENIAAWRQQMPHRDFVVAAPAGAYPVFSDHHDSRIWWPIGLSDTMRLQYLEQCAGYVGEVVDAMRARFRVSSVTVAGFSQGGVLAAYYGLTRPDGLDGLACFSSSLAISDELPRRALDFPVFCGWGLRDSAVPPEQSERLADFLEEQGCSVTRFSFDGSHEISIQELAEFCSWLDALDAHNHGNMPGTGTV